MLRKNQEVPSMWLTPNDYTIQQAMRGLVGVLVGINHPLNALRVTCSCPSGESHTRYFDSLTGWPLPEEPMYLYADYEHIGQDILKNFS